MVRTSLHAAHRGGIYSTLRVISYSLLSVLLLSFVSLIVAVSSSASPTAIISFASVFSTTLISMLALWCNFLHRSSIHEDELDFRQ